jgi:glycerol-3-phosphate acyltransferase PlsY
MEFPATAMIPVAFLSGSIPTGLLIGRAKGIDIRQHGSRNIGATNVGRVLGKPWFFVCFAVDFLKGCLPTLAAGHLMGVLGSMDPSPAAAWTWLAVMMAAVLGNVLNPWLGFKGGKGVATSIGAMAGVFPPLAAPGGAIFVVWLAMRRAFGYVSLASIVAGLALAPITACLFVAWGSARGMWPFVAVATVLGVLVVWTHRANIARLRAGTEPKAGVRVNAEPAKA